MTRYSVQPRAREFASKTSIKKRLNQLAILMVTKLLIEL